MKNKFSVFICFLFMTVLIFFICLKDAIYAPNPIENFMPLYNKMNIVIDGIKPYEVLFKVNNEYKTPEIKEDLTYGEFFGNIKSLSILTNREDKIKSLIVFNDLKPYYFKDLSAFKKSETKYCKDNICKNYFKYEVPKFIKWNKNSNSYNFKSYINAFRILILTVFSSCSYFLPFYLSLLLTMGYFIYANLKFPKINPYLIAVLIFLMGLTVRFAGIFEDYFPWGDESYSIEISDPKTPFITLFKDAGNPPLFYICLRLVYLFSSVNLVVSRTLPFLFGVLFLISIWFILKKLISTKAANIGLLISSINIPFVYYSNEIRSYGFQYLITILAFYSIFQIFYTNKKRYYILYGILAFLGSFLHYYSTIILSSFFVLGSIYFIFQKRYKDLFKFFLSNFIGYIPFIIYFIKTSIPMALLNNNFNDWIPKLSKDTILENILVPFGGMVSLILSLFFFVKNDFKDKEKFILNFAYISIWVGIIAAIILSVVIRPMIFPIYLTAFIPLFVIFLSVIFSQKVKYLILLFIIWLLFIQFNGHSVSNRRTGVFELPISIASQYIEIEKPKKNIYVYTFQLSENLTSEKNYDKIKFLFDKLNSNGAMVHNDAFIKNKDGILFTTLRFDDFENEKFKSTCYFNAAVQNKVCKVEVREK